MNYHATDAKHPHVRTFIASLLSYVLLASQLAPLTLGANGSFRSDPAKTSDTAQKKAPPQRARVATNPFAPVPVPLAVAHTAVAPNITATKVDTYPSAPGNALPGEIITYSVTITNSGPDPATNVTLSDTVDPNTTIVGTPNSTPVGFADAYSVLGNVRIQVPDGASDLLANDLDPDTDTNAGLTITTLAGDNSAPFSGTSTQNGQVTAASGNGSFEYNPPPGFTGTDTFTYIATDADGNSQPVTVTLTITGMIWFVNSAAAVGGDGRLTAPFNCYTGANSGAQTCFSATAADDPGDIIFLFSGNYIGGNTLLNNQRLIGQGATDTLASIGGVTVPTFSDALPATGGGSPVITTIIAATNAIPLGQGNLLRGFTVGNTTGAKIFGNAFGTLTVGNNVSPDVILNGAGQALNLTNGTFAATSAFSSVATTSSPSQGIILATIAGTVSLGSTTVSGSTTQGILVSTSTGNISFGNTSVSGGTDGVSLQNNSAGTRTFGTLSVFNNSGVGFLSGAGGGNASITGSTSIPAGGQTAPVGTAIDIQSLVGGTSVTFAATAINKGNAGTGVNLANNAGNVTFNSLAITTSNGSGLVGTNNTGQINVTTNAGSIAATGGPAINITKALAPATPITLNFATVSSTNSTTQGVNLDRVSGNLTNTTTTTTNPTGIGIQVQNSGAGTLNFGNTNSGGSGSTGVFLTANSAAITFGDLDILPDIGQRAFHATANTGTITSTSGDIANSNNVTIEIVGPAGRTPLSMTLNNVDSTNSTGIGVDMSLVSGNFTVNDAGTATNIQNPTGIGIRLQNSGAGTINFGNTTVNQSGGTGVFLNLNTGAVSFGSLGITPDAGQRGLHATSNTGTLTSTSGTITTTTNIAVEIVGTSTASRTPLNMTLTTVNTTGGTNGIILTNTSASPGGFTIAGNSSGLCGGQITPSGVAGTPPTVTAGNEADCTGGTIQNTTSDAIRLTDVVGVSFTRVLIKNIGSGVADNAKGIEAVNIGGSNFFRNGHITGLGNVGGAGGADRNGIDIRNSNTILTLFSIENSFFTNSDSGTSFVLNLPTGNAATRLDVINSIFQDLEAIAVQSSGGNGEGVTGAVTTNITGNVFRNATPNGQGGTAVTVNEQGASNTFNVSNNTYFDLNNGIASGINAGTAQFQVTGGILAGTCANNILGIAGVGNDNGDRRGIEVVAEPDVSVNGELGSFDVIIEGNFINRYPDREGIFVDMREDTQNSELIIRNNNIGNLVGFEGQVGGIREAVDVQARGETTKTLNLLMTGNNIRTAATIFAVNLEVNIDAGSNANISLQATVTSNTIRNTGGASELMARTRSGDSTGSLCLDMTGNTLDSGAGSIELDESGGPVNVEQASAAALAAANGIPAGNVLINGSPQFGVVCSVPPAATLKSKRSARTASEEATALQIAASQAGAPRAAAPTDSITSRPFISSSRLETSKALATTRTITPTMPTVNSTEPTKIVSFAPTDRPTTQKAKNPRPIPADDPTSNPPVVAPDGSSLTWNIGTLPAGQSVTITFQVQVDNPYTGPPQVSNQGTITFGGGGGPVLTDDPSVGGASDPTVTPIEVPLNVSISDATVAEPTSGTTSMLFTVALSGPATQITTINYNTADGSAVAPGDYVAVVGGSTTFQIGEQIKVIPITVNSDPDGAEGDENFTITITSGQANVVDGTATGTITVANTPGTLLISELRTSGPAGSADDFVEIYNNTDTPHVVTASDASPGYGVFKRGADCNATPILVGTIPNNTTIPARGHFLLVGSAYSLANYGGTGAAAGNANLTSDIEDDRNVSIFSTTDILQLSTTTRFDAVGFGTSTGALCDLQREGTNLGAVLGSTLEYSFFRRICNNNQAGCLTPGRPKETNDNVADFLFADTTATPVGSSGPLLGAPGPENLASPIKRDPAVNFLLLDASVPGPDPPNRVRDFTSDPVNNSMFGTMTIRRRMVNNTGASVTRLRFRIIDMTTAPAPIAPPGSEVADLRARTSVTVTGVSVNDSGTCAATGTPTTAPCTVTVQGLTLEQPPTQAGGGGYNSTLSAGTITLATSLAAGASVNVQFLLGVQQTGSFRFFIVVEALP